MARVREAVATVVVMSGPRRVQTAVPPRACCPFQGHSRDSTSRFITSPQARLGGRFRRSSLCPVTLRRWTPASGFGGRSPRGARLVRRHDWTRTCDFRRKPRTGVLSRHLTSGCVRPRGCGPWRPRPAPRPRPRGAVRSGSLLERGSFPPRTPRRGRWLPLLRRVPSSRPCADSLVCIRVDA